MSEDIEADFTEEEIDRQLKNLGDLEVEELTEEALNIEQLELDARQEDNFPEDMGHIAKYNREEDQ